MHRIVYGTKVAVPCLSTAQQRELSVRAALV